MKKCKLVLCSLFSSLGVLAYIMLVAWVMNHGNQWFGRVPDFMAATLVLLLLVISASITGSLVFGGPVWLYLQKKKSEAVKMLVMNICWLIILALAVIMVLIFK